MSQIDNNATLRTVNDRAIQKAITRAMKPHSRAERTKIHADVCAHLAAQNPVFSRVGCGIKARLFTNPPGRIAALIKRALPMMMRTNKGASVIRGLHYAWTAEMGRARKHRCSPRLFIFVSQIQFLKEIAALELDAA